jgi:hypothetical protein
MGMKQKGQLTQDEILARMSYTLRHPEWQNPSLFAPKHEGGLHDISNTLGLLERAFSQRTALVNRSKALGPLTSTISSGQALIRTDLDPMITNIFVEEFPGFDRIGKIEANGIAHNYVVSTDYDAADTVFVAELDVATKGHSAYSVENAPIAIALTERGTSLKELYGQRQSGMRWDGTKDVIDLELERGTIAIAYTLQKCFYQGTTVSGHTGTDEYGYYFTNGSAATGFQGLRGILGNPGGSFNSFYPTQSAVTVDQSNLTITQAINECVRKIMNNGSRPTAIHLSANAAEQLAREGGNLVRIDARDAGGVSLGVVVDAINTVAGRLPLVIVPGDSIGSYTPAQGAYNGTTVVEDIYVLNERVLDFAFLGAPNMVTIDIPVGVDGTLGHNYLLFGMFGLVARAASFCGKVRIPYVS